MSALFPSPVKALNLYIARDQLGNRDPGGTKLR